MRWTLLHPNMTLEHLGLIPYFLNESDPRPAKEQINTNYIGGWQPLPGFHLLSDNKLKYSTDPILIPLATTKLRDEIICFYQGAWLVIIQPNGTYEVARLD